MLTVILMYAVLAATFTIAKTALGYGSPYFLLGFRFITAGVLFLGLQRIFNKKNFFLRREDIWLFLWTAFFYIYLSFIPEFWALVRLSSSKVVILYQTTPFIVAIFAYFLASEKFTAKKIIGMVIGFVAIIPILLTHNQAGLSSEILKVSLAEAVLFIAIVSASYGWFPVKRLMNKGYTLPMINGVTMLVGGIGALLTSFAVEGVFVTHVFALKPFLFWTLLLVLAANGIFYNMYGWHLRRYSFTLLSFTGFLCPIFGSLYGWYFLSEQITWHHGLSLTLIIVGLFIFYKEELLARKNR